MANSISDTLQTYFNKLPSSLQGNGQNFIFLLKDMLKDLTGELNSKFEEISKIANSITDAPDTITEQLKNCTISEKRVGTNISLTLNWDYSAITNYDSAEIFVRTSTDLATDWSTVDVNKTITTTKTGSYVLNGCNAGTVYHFTFLGKNTYGSVSVESSAPTLTYEVSAMNNIPDAPTEFEVYTSKTGLVWKWKQPVGIDYSVSELRLDTNVGSTTNLLEVTQDCTSDVQPSAREGTAYLYNKGYGSKYSEPVTTTWSKPVATAPQGLTVTPTFQGLQITYGAIPEDCIGIVISINGERHYTSDEKFNFYCSTGSYEIRACYYDCFGYGTWTTVQTVQTALEIPPDAVHITNTTVFDDGVIVGKYIGDKQVVGTKIADGTITTGNISAGAVTANQIASNAITSDKVTADAITADKIATGAVTTDKLTALAVTADKLAVNSVTADKLNAETINMAGALKVVGGNVTLDESGLTVAGSDGNQVLFNGSGVVYKSSAGAVYNVLGKMASGSLSDGQTVQFNNAWKNVPNITLVPQNIQISSPDYSQQHINLHVYADNITNSGFTAHCYTSIYNSSGSFSCSVLILNGNWDYHYGVSDYGSINGNVGFNVPGSPTKVSANGHITITRTVSEYGDAPYSPNSKYTSSANIKVYSGSTLVGETNVTILNYENITPRTANASKSVSFSVDINGSDLSNLTFVTTANLVNTQSRVADYFNGQAYIDSYTTYINGEQKLNSGTCLFLATDQSNANNYTIS